MLKEMKLFVRGFCDTLPIIRSAIKEVKQQKSPNDNSKEKRRSESCSLGALALKYLDPDES